MITHISALLAFILPFCCFSQTYLSGIINQYAKVTALDPCTGKLTLANAAAFNAGDQVLLIQMQGASIEQSNSPGFGNILNLNGAGFFEKNEVAAKAGNEVFLKYSLLNSYEASGSLQLVTFPAYAEATVSDTLRAAPWNGETGGVLALEVENTLTLNAPMDVSGAGFRGGAKSVVNSGCSFLTNASDYFYDASNWRGASKGEGIATAIPGKENGRGAQANGGGGGNDHNSGGGGGASLVAGGGPGGRQTPSSTFGCRGDFPGLGGKTGAPGMTQRIFMGGGGGAGHTDDTGAGSSGGNGGGIILLQAGTITAEGQVFFSNGKTPPQANGDGAGGGGAGGSILIEANALMGTIAVEAKGGDGGNVKNSPDRCFGPGGGGSGGRLIASLPSFAAVNLSGGVAGVNSTLASQCNGLSNEAGPGADGQQDELAGIPASLQEILPAQVLQQPVPALVCEGEQAVFLVQAQGVSLNYQWQINNGTGWSDLTDNATYAGVLTAQLSIANVPVVLDGSQYRCRITGPCISQLLSEAAGLTVEPAPVASFLATTSGDGFYQFTNTSLGANSYSWDFGDGSQSNEQSPSHVYAQEGIFIVILTVTGDCGTDLDSQQVVVVLGQPPQAAFYADIPSGCAPLTVQFENQSTGTDNWGFFWQFPGGTPATSQEENPVVIYSLPGTYDVTFTVTNNLGESALTKEAYIQAFEVPQAGFNFNIAGQTVSFFNQSSGGSSSFWLFGDGSSSTEVNPVHEYASSGTFNVSLTVANGNCGSAISQLVRVGATSIGEAAELPAFSAFPNPAGDKLTIVFSKNYAPARKVRLWNTQGQICKILESNGERQTFSLAGLPVGIYFLEAGGLWRKIVKGL